MIRFIITILTLLILSACSTNNATNNTNVKKKMNQPQKSYKSVPSSANSNCYDFGFQWGVCAAKNTENRSCLPGKDVGIPENCMDDPKTQDGIKEGIRSIQRGVQQ